MWRVLRRLKTTSRPSSLYIGLAAVELAVGCWLGPFCFLRARSQLHTPTHERSQLHTARTQTHSNHTKHSHKHARTYVSVHTHSLTSIHARALTHSLSHPTARTCTDKTQTSAKVVAHLNRVAEMLPVLQCVQATLPPSNPMP